MRSKKPPSSAEGPDRETIGARRRREKHERAAAFLAGKPVFAGVDLGKDRHAVWLAGRDADLALIERFTIDNSPDGLEKLVRHAEQHCQQGGFDRLIVFMEATSYIWQNVANFLEGRGIAYRIVSPLAVDRQREIEHLTYAKGDYRDAELIVSLGAKGQYLACELGREALWIELEALAREHEALLKAEIRERLRVRSFLELGLPEFLECFDDPLKKTSRSLLRKLTRKPDEIPATVARFLEQAAAIEGVRLLRSKLRALKARLELDPSFGVERLLAPLLARIGLAVQRFELLHDQREAIRSRLVDLYRRTPYSQILDTIPGVSPESHALLLGLVGDPKRFDRATCLVKLAGTEPRENHSGRAEGAHSISRRGRSPLRHLLYRIVMGFPRGNAQFAAYLDHLRNRAKNQLSRRQAAVAAGNKYLRLVYHLCFFGEPYDSSKLAASA